MHEGICGRSRRITRHAIFRVQPSQNRCREHPSVFGEAMAGGRELVGFVQRIGNPGSQAGMWAAPVIVDHPVAKNPSEMSLVNGDQPVQTLPTHRADQSFANALACGVHTGVFSTCRAVDAIARSTVAAKMLSRSWRTNRWDVSGVMTMRNCWIVHSAVGCSVTFQWRIRRVPTSRTTNT
jgi:hypothetical protein